MEKPTLHLIDDAEQADLKTDVLGEIPHEFTFWSVGARTHRGFRLVQGVRYAVPKADDVEIEIAEFDSSYFLVVRSGEEHPDLRFFALNQNSGFLVERTEEDLEVGPDGCLVRSSDNDYVFDINDPEYPEPTEFLAAKKPQNPRMQKVESLEEARAYFEAGLGFIHHDRDDSGYVLKSAQRYHLADWFDANLEWDWNGLTRRLRVLDGNDDERSLLFILMNKSPKGILVLPQKTLAR